MPAGAHADWWIHEHGRQRRHDRDAGAFRGSPARLPPLALSPPNDNTPIGDLVRDAISDAEYPWAGNAPEGLAHIRACGACFGAVAAMRQAIVEYRRSR